MQEFQDLIEEVDDIIKLANVLGTDFFKKSASRLSQDKNYRSVFHDYNAVVTEFSGLCQNLGTMYSNRAESLLKLEKCKSALGDTLIALEINKKDAKAHLNLVKCYITLGDIAAAEKAIKRTYKIFGKEFGGMRELNFQLKKLRFIDAKLSSSFDAGDFENTFVDLKRALKYAPGCIRYRILRAECITCLGQADMSVKNASSILRNNPKPTKAPYATGLCSYLESNEDVEIEQCENVLLNSEHEKFQNSREFVKNFKKLIDLKEKGNAIFMQHKFHEAIAIYTEGLNKDKDNKTLSYKLLHNRALGYFNLRDYEKAIDDCIAALALRKEYHKAFILRGRCYSKLGMFKECIADFKAAYKLCYRPEITKLIFTAKLNLKCSSEISYYAMLGINMLATEKEIKKAYKKLALKYHPDKHSNDSVTKRSKAEQIFKEINKAYTTLTDPVQKLRYDESLKVGKKYYRVNEDVILRKFFCDIPYFWN